MHCLVWLIYSTVPCTNGYLVPDWSIDGNDSPLPMRLSFLSTHSKYCGWIYNLKIQRASEAAKLPVLLFRVPVPSLPAILTVEGNVKMQNKHLFFFILFCAGQHVFFWPESILLNFVTKFVLISQHLLFSSCCFLVLSRSLFQLLTACNCPSENAFRMFPITCSLLPGQTLPVIWQNKNLTTLGTSPCIFQNVLTPWSDVMNRLSSVTSLLESLL